MRRDMTRAEWRTLYREARTAVSQAHPSDREGCQKDCITLDRAVVKRPLAKPYMGRDQADAYFFLTYAEECEAWRFLYPEDRPWTIFHPRGFCIQELADMDGWRQPWFESINKGFSDLHANNWGESTEDGRNIIIDWGVLKAGCGLAERFDRQREIKRRVAKERARRRYEGLGQSGRNWVLTTGHALRDRLDELGVSA